MKQKPIKKLELKKQTITKLSEKQMSQVQGGSFTVMYTAGCATDFTRIIRTISISFNP